MKIVQSKCNIYVDGRLSRIEPLWLSL